MANKSVLELLANAPKSEVRTLPMSLPEQRGNPANLAALQAAKASTDIRRNVARERLALNRYLAAPQKAKSVGSDYLNVILKLGVRCKLRPRDCDSTTCFSDAHTVQQAPIVLSCGTASGNTARLGAAKYFIDDACK